MVISVTQFTAQLCLKLPIKTFGLSFHFFCFVLLTLEMVLLIFLLFLCVLQSSLAAARADNFYYPPEWSPKKVNRYTRFPFFNSYISVSAGILDLEKGSSY